jgi:hypothetical protein
VAAVIQWSIPSIRVFECNKPSLQFFSGYMLRLNPGPQRGRVEVNGNGYTWKALAGIRQTDWSIVVLNSTCRHAGYEFGRILPFSTTYTDGICLNKAVCMTEPDFLCLNERHCTKGYTGNVVCYRNRTGMFFSKKTKYVTE